MHILALLALLGATGTAAPPDILYDNGKFDLQNGLPNGTEEIFGARRTLLDDFTVPEGERWLLSEMRWLTVYLEDELVGTSAEISLRLDSEGVPGDTIQTLNVTSYCETFTGHHAFEYEEVETWATFEPVALDPGRYWFEANAIAPENNFWLTAPLSNNECWVNYQDMNGLESSSDQFGVAYDLAWSLLGVRADGDPGACCFPSGQCVRVSFDDCAAQGGLFQGSGTVCVVDTCGEAGACCVGDDTCVSQSELFCAVFGGFYVGPSIACEDVQCAIEASCGAFGKPVAYADHGRALHIALGDLDGDLDPDLVATNGLADAFAVRLNDGDGSFGPITLTTTALVPAGIGLGDLDGDLDLDVAIADQLTDAVVIHRNNGDASFAPGVTYPAGVNPRGVVVEDLDGDDDLDLALATTTPLVSVLLNDGDGTFAPVTSYLVGGVPFDVKAADLDGDDDVDLVTVNLGSVSVLLNAGDGTFGAAATYDVAPDAVGLAVGDVDGDLDIDVVTANGDTDEYLLLRNDGTGVLASPVRYAAGAAVGAPRLHDLDGDGDLDIASANRADDNVVTRFNGGPAVFGPVLEIPIEDPEALVAADVDGDGDVDLVMANPGLGTVTVVPNLCMPCAGDIDGSGAVDFADILRILAAWGMTGRLPEDLDGSGIVDFGDLLVVLGSWGPCP